MISSDQIAKNYDIAGVRKANLPGLHMLLLGFFAGMFIALAGAAASVASADITNPSAARIVSALVFPAGLAMVICNGSELFTGNCLMVISLLDHKITFKALMKNYLVANMFYIPAGMMTASAYGIAAEGLNIGTFILNNLIPATIGNIFGGVIVVGCLYWYLFLREKN